MPYYIEILLSMLKLQPGQSLPNTVLPVSVGTVLSPPQMGSGGHKNDNENTKAIFLKTESTTRYYLQLTKKHV